jgi:hypothetical protein
MTSQGCSSPDFTVTVEKCRSRQLRLLARPAPGSGLEVGPANAARLVLVTLAETWKNLPTGAGFTGPKVPVQEGWLVHNSPEHQARFAPLLPLFWSHDHQVSARTYQAARHDLGRQGWQLDNQYYTGGRIVRLAGDSTIHYLSVPARGADARHLGFLEARPEGAADAGGPAWRITADFREDGWTELLREGWQIKVHAGGYLCPHCQSAVEGESYLEVREAWEDLPRRHAAEDRQLKRHIIQERYRCVRCGTGWEHDFSHLDHQ